MDAIAARVNARTPKSRGDMKPKTHHFFYGLIVVCGWLAPPLAIAIRFGIGKDFFINLILTIAGYFPGHFHKCVPPPPGRYPAYYCELTYCQNIRNNTRRGRTPKWAVKLGLVKVKGAREGKHQWAGRYDERLPDSARYAYDDASSIRSGSNGDWDGRGPEPARRNGHSHGIGSGGSGLAPWGRVVDASEVEGNGYSRSGRVTDNSERNGTYDPLTNEQFFSTSSQTDDPLGLRRPASLKNKSSKKGIKDIMRHRSRYESQGDSDLGNRHDRMAAARNGSARDEFQDDFEREINRGSTANAGYDALEDGPEDAWASSRPSNGQRQNGAAESRPTKQDDSEISCIHDLRDGYMSDKVL
ncbi:hypothetical protein OIV83_001460 [Microbotryomycetes sp. JL201]|nr:hypothetical protein OIV83_001460 [Microbotryomycetes sp. JL201]